MLLTLLLGLALQNAAQPKPAAVRGRVTAADTGAPLKHAFVTVRNGPDVTFSAATDAEGRYEISNVAPGNYFAVCEKSGYINSTYRQPGEPRTSLQVAAGQQITDINFTMPRAGVITGKVTDEDGEAIVNANVQAIVRLYRQGRSVMSPLATAVTDDLGVYRLHDLPAGRYFVQATKRPVSGRPGMYYAPSIYPGVAHASDAQSVLVTGGAEAGGINFRSHESAVYTVSGRVMDIRTAQPIANSVISFLSEDVLSAGWSTASIGANGAFRITNLVAGRYHLQFSSERSNVRVSGVKTLDVNADLSGVTLNVGPGATIRVRLRAEGGDLPKNLSVSLNREGTDALDEMTIRSRADGDGTFEFSGVRAGDYDFDVYPAPPGPSSFFVRDVVVGHQPLGDAYLNIPDGSPSLELTATLDFRVGSISGQLTDSADPDNKPLPQTEIAVVSADPKKRAVEHNYHHVATDAKGHFQVTGLSPGDYWLVPWDGDDSWALMDPDLAARLEKLAVSVSVSALAATTQDLKMTPELRTIAQGASQ
jgi:protocatechuate 3,4-dioxygenase beta subunit